MTRKSTNEDASGVSAITIAAEPELLKVYRENTAFIVRVKVDARKKMKNPKYFISKIGHSSHFGICDKPQLACQLSSQMVKILTHRYVLLNTSQVSDRVFIEEMADTLSSYLIKKPLSNRVRSAPQGQIQRIDLDKI